MTATVATRLPEPALPETEELRRRYAFDRQHLTSLAVRGEQERRQVSPGVAHISTWISALGAAVALGDVDGNGLPDDQCLVDPRTDTITVAPVAGGSRYASFVLDPAPLPYDPVATAPMGCLPGDFNGDGRLDLVTYYWGRTPVLFLRTADPTTGPGAYVRQEVMPTVERWYTDSILSTDVDGDGHLDLVVGNYFPDGARLLDPRATDDPLMQMQDSMSRAYNGGTKRFLLGGPGGSDPGSVRFVDVPGVLPRDAERAWTLAIGAYDFNGDLLPELYFANDFGPDRFYLNRSTPGAIRLEPLLGERGATTPRSKALGQDSFKGMSIDFADMDGDGHTDMFVSNITSEFGLMESHFAWRNTGRVGDMNAGTAPFEDRSEEFGLARSGWGWDAKFGDFDNDGTPELVQTTGFTKGEHNLWPQVAELAMANDEVLHHLPTWMRHTPGWELAGRDEDAFFVRGTDGRWGSISDLVGLGGETTSRGVATADVNGDGRLDFAVARQWEDSYLFVNRGQSGDTSLNLKLLLPPAGAPAGPTTATTGAGSNTVRGSPAIGATATVLLPDGQRMVGQVDGGNGHSSVRSPELHFGLGDLPGDRQLTVRLDWRDRQGQLHHRDVTVSPGRWTILLGE
ncbi:CRTAC1 family protein [Plantactinospora mayteni]|uniref:CRTAC1 family protein n=1 Tax=Plantactinospora mayteni TaxID=566021 RepID=UPI001EF3F7C8|nr:CRTAC1 family protein [Plantactinospora mayteni]